MKYKGFLSFLLVVLVVASLWFISKYKDIYSDEVNFRISFEDVPEDLLLESDSFEISTPVEIQATGFTLIWEKMFGHQLQLGFSENVYDRNDSIFFNPSRSFKNIKRSKSNLYKIVSAEDVEIHVKVKRFKSKKVVVKHDYKINYFQNFAPLSKPFFRPDTILITGNDQRVMDTSELFLSSEDTIVIKDSITIKKIDLQTLFPDLKFDHPEIDFVIEAAQMTEGTIGIKVELQNVPKNTMVKLIPENVSLIYTTQLKHFDSVDATDFSAVVDYRSLQGLNTAAIPDIQILNSKIVSYRVDPKQVQVLTIN